MTGSELVQLGTDIVNDAQARGMVMRMCEGVAILARCPSIETHTTLHRSYHDLDFIVAADAWKGMRDFFAARNFLQKTESSNARIFEKEGAVVEVMRPTYQRQFALDFSTRLNVTPLTLPLADLLLLKLARTDFEQKDIQDCAALLVDHRVTNGGDEEEEINREYFYKIVNANFRLWRTVFDNTVTLEQVFDQYLEPEEAQLAWRRTELLQEVLDGKSHSLSWWAGRMTRR